MLVRFVDAHAELHNGNCNEDDRPTAGNVQGMQVARLLQQQQTAAGYHGTARDEAAAEEFFDLGAHVWAPFYRSDGRMLPQGSLKIMRYSANAPELPVNALETVFTAVDAWPPTVRCPRRSPVQAIP